jgi:rhodanese-related sulfurtransferase
MPELIDLSAQAAYAYLQTTPNSILIDIRSTSEFMFVGHPTDAVHIAWLDEPDWEINPDFVPTIKRLLESHCKGVNPYQDVSIILICRSGKRSYEAGYALIEAGFAQVMHVHEGFEGVLDNKRQRSTVNGWRFQGLPWEQS